ncbi:TrgA family protein [Rhodobacter sp. Har01]|uniref:TrgA family protein n=1 Tax=Rhodobacter sp. Har01 TaxID=2883999 RepID=UPI001D08F6B5|nr:TrgA family protein [Rhodobacter sp. Har01]MCB6176676.1 TrgA family protein [Rhodobacter sp. Har01]
MPTAAKLVAALCFAAVGWLAANAHVPALGSNASVGAFREMTALIGLLIGWRVMGNRVGKGMAEAVGSGLLTSMLLVFFALLLFSGYLMIDRSLTSQPYDGPMDAVLGVFELMMEQGRKMLTVGVLGVLILGGMLGGAAAEWARARWR